ncbi:MAG: peptidase M28 [Acidobacteria bacterium]|nr:MAG: peptidase M28 [Acidobacteriota bacterium]
MRRWEILCSTGVALGLLLSAPVCPEEWDPPDFSPPTPSPESRIPAFHGSRAFDDLKRLVEFGPRPPGSKALAESRRWITDQLKQSGCEIEEDSFVADTPVGQVPMTNLIAKVPGARPEVLMVAGHYDTKRFDTGAFVGANDGASSTAFLLELGRMLGRRKNPATYWLVFFDGEEAFRQWSSTDSLYGSRHLAAKLTASGELSRIHAMVLVDMIADANLDIRRDSSSTRWLTDLIFQTAKRLGYSRYFLDQPTAVEDDHLPFVNAGVSAADVIDLDYGPPGNSYHHTTKDTVDKCSPASMTIVGRVVTAMLEELENSLRAKH